MFKKQLTREDYFIIASNLVPVLGALFLGWTAKEIFIVYAMETLIVGTITVLKMATVTLYRKNEPIPGGQGAFQKNGLFLIIFFIIHFGIFALVQTAIFSGTSGISKGGGPFDLFLHWPRLINKDIALMLGAFIISYLARDIFPFFLREEYKTVPMMKLMFQPYGRILIQQFTVIIGSMFLSFGLGIVFVIVFAFVKIFFEVAFNFNAYLDIALKKQMEERSGKQ